jgi:hypothetical protein
METPGGSELTLFIDYVTSPISIFHCAIAASRATSTANQAITVSRTDARSASLATAMTDGARAAGADREINRSIVLFLLGLS